MTDPTTANTGVFPNLPPDHLERLRAKHYNATITSIRAHNPDLWVMRVRPDSPPESFTPGQYTTLGLGYWEPRVDDVSEDFDEHPKLLEKMVRRSYSVSSSIVDDRGRLLPALAAEIEFYIVLVAPSPDRIPGLTPRIFKKSAGDRIYLGRKFTGRYTLEGVDPADNVVFLATGTGEAPHNQMTGQLLRNKHGGRTLQVVCVRYRNDLAYIEQHKVIQNQYPGYRYVPLTTREPENEGNKVYIQDLALSGGLEAELESPLDPANTHVYLCGNPEMIGLPQWDDDGSMRFPETLGMCEILHDRGFTLDHRRQRGNVHFEEYWKAI
jgi:ferredoxin/flavodoxin---NADP+ reductase